MQCFEMDLVNMPPQILVLNPRFVPSFSHDAKIYFASLDLRLYTCARFPLWHHHVFVLNSSTTGSHFQADKNHDCPSSEIIGSFTRLSYKKCSQKGECERGTACESKVGTLV